MSVTDYRTADAAERVADAADRIEALLHDIHGQVAATREHLESALTADEAGDYTWRRMVPEVRVPPSKSSDPSGEGVGTEHNTSCYEDPSRLIAWETYTDPVPGFTLELRRREGPVLVGVWNSVGDGDPASRMVALTAEDAGALAADLIAWSNQAESVSRGVPVHVFRDPLGL